MGWSLTILPIFTNAQRIWSGLVMSALQNLCYTIINVCKNRLTLIPTQQATQKRCRRTLTGKKEEHTRCTNRLLRSLFCRAAISSLVRENSSKRRRAASLSIRCTSSGSTCLGIWLHTDMQAHYVSSTHTYIHEQVHTRILETRKDLLLHTMFNMRWPRSRHSIIHTHTFSPSLCPTATYSAAATSCIMLLAVWPVLYKCQCILCKNVHDDLVSSRMLETRPATVSVQLQTWT